VDNLVSVLVVQERGDLSRREMKRVLAPRGTLCLKTRAGWTFTRKNWPSALDEWPHYMHDPKGTFVSQDQRLAPPQGAALEGRTPLGAKP